MEPEQTLTQQKTRNAYANLHILHSKNYKLYKQSLGLYSGQTYTSNSILDNEIATLCHKRKKTN